MIYCKLGFGCDEMGSGMTALWTGWVVSRLARPGLLDFAYIRECLMHHGLRCSYGSVYVKI